MKCFKCEGVGCEKCEGKGGFDFWGRPTDAINWRDVEEYEYWHDEWYEDDERDWPMNACEAFSWEHSDDVALMFWCEACERWHLTDAGYQMDQLYRDVLPMPAYVWADIPL